MFRASRQYPFLFSLLSSVVLALLIGGHSPQAALAQEPTGATAETLTEATVDEDSETSVGADSDQPTEFGAHQAGGMIVLMQNEIQDGLRQRRIESTFAQFERFAKGKLQSSAYGRGGEVTGICRLGWYDHLMRNIIKAPAEAQDFTRDLHKAFASEHEGLDRALGLVAEKVDLATREASEFATIDSPEAAIDQVRRSLLESQMAFAAALDPLSRSEISRFSSSAYSTFTSGASNGHTLPSRGAARSFCQMLGRMDREKMHDAASALVPLANPAIVEQLRRITGGIPLTVPGVAGEVQQRILTSGGDILVGGTGSNTYDLDNMANVSAVIDLGGDDTYVEGTVSIQRPVLVILDLGGNDTYRGSKPGIQGGAILGVSMLLDAAGNDTYQAKDVAQGSALGGAGILIDREGSDAYVGLRRVQGHALGGLGILLDRAGNDRYHAAMWAQGFGNPLGFGVLDDLSGDDHYFCGGLYYDSYEETPGYEGWGQGIGAGLRQVANGGIGVILDGGGDDQYEFDYIAHGGGYWLGVGVARDFGGNDERLGATTKMYNGSARRERRFQRFSNGFGCHYTIGFLIDDEGDDSYNGTIMGTGFAWDCSVGYLMDFGGNDSYLATGGGTQGQGKQAGLGVLYDYDGDDVYKGYGQGLGSGGIDYHPLPDCGGNFSFVIDYGGEDQYGCRAKNNSYNRRGASGGFLIDRPRNTERATTADASPKTETPGS